MGIISKIKSGSTTHLVASSAFGKCTTGAGTAAKVVTLSDFDTFIPGMTIYVRFTNSNTAASPTLNVNSQGAKPIYKYSTVVPKANEKIWEAGAIVSFTYETDSNANGCWQMSSSAYNIDSCYVDTPAATAAKLGTLSNYVLQPGNLQVAIYNSNTSATALTLNINGQGAKPIYINGSASSTTNYTLPQGMYLVYYDGTNYYFNTQGILASKSALIDNKVSLQYNSTTESLDFVFI